MLCDVILWPCARRYTRFFLKELRPLDKCDDGRLHASSAQHAYCVSAGSPSGDIHRGGTKKKEARECIMRICDASVPGVETRVKMMRCRWSEQEIVGG